MKFELPEKLAFLKSPRFWAMVLGIFAAYLDGTMTLAQSLQAFGAGFLAIGTIDRTVDKVKEKKAEEINAPV